MDRDIYVVIHGHFYQPPRENPWLDFVERQPSAYPFRDWNERVTAECYTPNTVSRILDPTGKIDDIVNNCEFLDFNFGPTLLQWLERHAPRTYARIIEADGLSRSRNNGHGNAVAQGFSHMILPLANDADLRTQIVWGKRDFLRRFGRQPEGMWLPETAANNRVMSALEKNGIRFTILSPTQAQSVRKIGEADWHDVSGGGVDTRQPYRYFVKDSTGKTDPKRFVDMFFFNEPVSRAMSFEHLMTSAGRFADALAAGADSRKGAQLVNVATDGETFGHHEPFADMCLAAFFDREAPRRGLKIVNYAYYLDIAPPAMEVDIKPGPNGEGTSWSCAHGTGRWQRDCGDSTGGPSWWHQKWRAPMRKAFDNLRANLDDIFQTHLSPLLEDPKAARDDYVTVASDHSRENIEAFLKAHLKKTAAQEDKVKVLKLMESQENAMYMYTSCGWFFAEISGIEAVQNMRYAARAVELAEEYTDKPLMQQLLADLCEAPSNIQEMKDGRAVFRRLVWPSMMTMDKIVAASVMSALLTDNGRVWQPLTHAVEQLSAESLPDKYRSSFGMARATSRVTLESRLFAYFVTQFTPRDVRCYIKRIADSAEFQALRERLEVMDKANLPEVFQGKFTSWGDLLPEVSSRIMSVLVEKDVAVLRDHFTELFQQNRELFEALVLAGLELPYEIRGLVRYALSRLLHDEVLGRRGNWRPDNFAQAREYVAAAKRFGVEIDTKEVDGLITEDLLSEAEAIRGDLSAKHFQNVIAILDIGRQLGLSLRRDLVENIVLEILEEKVMPWIKSLKDPRRDREDYGAIMEILDYAERLNFSRRRYAAMLEDFEKTLRAAQ